MMSLANKITRDSAARRADSGKIQHKNTTKHRQEPQLLAIVRYEH